MSSLRRAFSRAFFVSRSWKLNGWDIALLRARDASRFFCRL
jgi:hypothetical protein